MIKPSPHFALSLQSKSEFLLTASWSSQISCSLTPSTCVWLYLCVNVCVGPCACKSECVVFCCVFVACLIHIKDIVFSFRFLHNLFYIWLHILYFYEATSYLKIIKRYKYFTLCLLLLLLIKYLFFNVKASKEVWATDVTATGSVSIQI